MSERPWDGLPIGALDGLTDDDKKLLCTLGIHSPNALNWRLIHDPTIDSALNQTDPTTRSRVVEAAARYAVRRAGRIVSRPAADHLLDLMIAAAVLGIMFAVSRNGLRPPAAGHRALIVQAPAGIAPFHVITAGDVALTASDGASSLWDSVDQAVGRYPLAYLPRGAAVERWALSKGQPLTRELDGLQIAQIGLPIDPLLEAVVPPQIIALASASSTANVYVTDVYVLGVEKRGDVLSTTVATKPDNMKLLMAAASSGKLTPISSAR